ncbi:flavin monoamine oxidase family protein [uncultured Croceitalea sp.]|uniref:flavin monoamine oxidase family protein n=1 Tax=uncultured Croceitalea sp. TaxID=1798908 RepID=UPI00374FD387
MNRRIFIQNTVLASAALGILPISCAKAAPDTEYLILGGGISGLFLANLLEKAGKDYILLEGSNRLGGRMFTRTDINRDVGGRGIGDKYDNLLPLINEVGAELIDITDFMSAPTAVYMNGELKYPWPEGEIKPYIQQFMALGKSDYLSGLDQWYQNKNMDEPYATFLKQKGLSDKEIELADISLNYNDIYKTSAINAHHSRAFGKYNGSKRALNFKGGTINFINKVVDTLKKPVLINKMITQINDSGASVTVNCEDGSNYKAKKVICTLPFTTLRDVKMDAKINKNQSKAIKKLSYTNITQIHLAHTENYWEIDDVPLDMWTDTPIERIMNMSSSPTEKQIACWVNGKGTAFFDTMTENEIADYTIKKINEIRPASKGKLEYLGTQNWGKYEYNKGAYVEFAPGQAEWFLDMIKPAGNVHFAGEHTAHENRGMEAAAESANRVYKELIS